MIETIFLFTSLVVMSGLLSSHPLIMCLFLILYSGMVGLILGVFITKWFMAALILIFLGGMMVIFFYSTSLAIHDKISMKINHTKYFSLLLALTFMSYSSQNFFNLNIFPLASTIQLYSTCGFNTIMFLMIYLLLTLFLVVKMSLSFKGTLLRSF